MRTNVGRKVPSNSFIGVGSWVLMFAIFLGTFRFLAAQQELAGAVALAALSLLFFGTATAQLYSGYLWRNLSPGNRGLHRSDAPTRFLFATLLHFAIGAGILAFALWRYVQHA